jgi:glycosyltransferase involved in cell wall biosynthesis
MSERSASPTFLSVLVPAYNEERSIAETLINLTSALEAREWNYEIIVASDGSTDNTVKVVSDLRLDHVRVLPLQDNKGKGAALISAFEHSRNEYVAFFDADGDIAVESLIDLIQRLLASKADAIVGSKIHPGSEVQYPLFRRIQSFGFRLLIKHMFSIPVSDTQTGVKIFRREVLDCVVHDIDASGFEFDLELIVSAVNKGFTVIDGPVHLNFRFESTVRPKDAYLVLRGTFRTQRKFRSRSQPS